MNSYITTMKLEVWERKVSKLCPDDLLMSMTGNSKLPVHQTGSSLKWVRRCLNPFNCLRYIHSNDECDLPVPVTDSEMDDSAVANQKTSVPSAASGACYNFGEKTWITPIQNGIDNDTISLFSVKLVSAPVRNYKFENKTPIDRRVPFLRKWQMKIRKLFKMQGRKPEKDVPSTSSTTMPWEKK